MVAVALIASSLLAVAARAKADQIYWANQNVISYSQLNGTEGGYLPASVLAIHAGNGTAIDTANSRIYVSQEATNQIAWFSLDGISAGVVNTAGATVDHPTNVAINPATQTLYWSNAVSPGSVATPMTEAWIQKAKEPEVARAKLYSVYPLGYIAEPADVAGAILFLAGPDARCITGANLVVDCGITASFAESAIWCE